METAIENAAKAMWEAKRLAPWKQLSDEGKEQFRSYAAAVYPFVAAAVERRTANAIADAIADVRCIHGPGDEFASGWITGRSRAAGIARAFPDRAETE